jgi:hypothetical protein
MKKLVIRNVLIELVILLLPVLSMAGSDMRKGDKGEGVREAQEWLIELGYLQDEADGIFGKKTEAAVKEFQKTIGAKTTGTLSPQQLDELQFLQMDATAVMEGDGLGEDELQEMYPKGCCRTDDQPGAVDFCWRHFEAGRLTARLRLPALPDKAILLFAGQAVPLWEQAMLDLYAEWAEEQPEVAEEQLSVYEKEYQEKKTELEKKHGSGSAKRLQELAYWLEDVCVDRCFDLHTAEGNSD